MVMVECFIPFWAGPSAPWRRDGTPGFPDAPSLDSGSFIFHNRIKKRFPKEKRLDLYLSLAGWMGHLFCVMVAGRIIEPELSPPLAITYSVVIPVYHRGAVTKNPPVKVGWWRYSANLSMDRGIVLSSIFPM
jgi:hypothetical protein